MLEKNTLNDEKFYQKIQEEKMKELWNNEEDEAWENHSKNLSING
jgi:hypothetical protein